MAEFIVRARKAPTDPTRFLTSAGSGAHVEYLAQIVVNTLFVSKGHRTDTTLTLVLEGAADYSKILVLKGDSLGSFGDVSEQGVLKVLANSLKAGSRLGKEQSLTDDQGIVVMASSFERLVSGRRELATLYLLDRKGADIRGTELDPDGIFLMTDHIPMPKKAAKSLIRKGATSISLGPVMLHTSQCVVVIQNELDRQ